MEDVLRAVRHLPARSADGIGGRLVARGDSVANVGGKCPSLVADARVLRVGRLVVLAELEASLNATNNVVLGGARGRTDPKELGNRPARLLVDQDVGLELRVHGPGRSGVVGAPCRLRVAELGGEGLRSLGGSRRVLGGRGGGGVEVIIGKLLVGELAQHSTAQHSTAQQSQTRLKQQTCIHPTLPPTQPHSRSNAHHT